MEIVASLGLLGYCLALRRFTRWPIETIPFFLISTIMVLFYIFTYMGILKIASLAFILLGGGLLIASYWYLPHNRESLINNYFTPAFILLIFFICLFALNTNLFPKYFVATGWDELVRWMGHAKIVYTNNAFWQSSNIWHPDYPPGTAVFYYYFLRLPGFAEYRLSFAQIFLTLAPLTILLRKYRWSNWPNAFILFATLIVFLIAVFGLTLGRRVTLYVDQILGIWFACIILSYFLMQQIKSYWIYLATVLMAFVLFKPMLLPFVAVIAAVIYADQLYLYYQKQEKWKNFLWYSLAFLMPILIMSSWQHYLSKYLHMSSSWSMGALLTAIINKKMTISPQQFYQVLPAYLHLIGQYVLFALLMGLLVVLVSRWVADQQQKNRLLLSQIIIGLGFLGYLALLLLLYFFVMNQWIVLIQDSFARFVDMYVIGWIIILLGQALYFVDQPIFTWLNKIPQKLKYGGVVAILIFYGVQTSFYDYNHYYFRFQAKQSPEYVRYIVQKQLTDPLNQLTEKDSNIAFIWHTGGWDLLPLMVYSDLLPRNVSYGNEMVPGANPFPDNIKQFNYLLVGGNDLNNELQHKYGKYLLNKVQKPFAVLSICFDKQDINRMNTKNCVFRQVPFFLYKVENNRSGLALLNITKVS